MAVQPIGSETVFPHESEMAQALFEILVVPGQMARFRQYRTTHEDGITHLVVVRHRFEWLAIGTKSPVCGRENQFGVALVSSQTSEF